jgi:ribose 5-phosphate isomerase B
VPTPESQDVGGGVCDHPDGLVGNVARVKIAFGTDERTALTKAVVTKLRAEGHEVTVVADGVDWPEAGRAVGEAVAWGAAARGVVCCTTGTGVSIAANKVPGARAALCTDAVTAEGARRWNDANILAFGLRLTTEALAGEMLDAFLSTTFDAGETAHVGRVEPESPSTGRGPGRPSPIA